MKKVLLVVAIAGFMTSCKDKKEEKKAEETTTTTPTTTEPTTTTPTTTEPTTTTTTTSVPTFKDADVQKYAADYTEFVTSYVAAYKTKDMSKVQDYAMKASEWASRSMDISKKLMANPEEAQKFSTYMAKLGDDLRIAMTGK